MSILRDHLEAMVAMRSKFTGRNPGWHYACLEDYILQKGSEGNAEPLTKRELNIVSKLLCGNVFPQQMCYMNSQKVALDDHRLLYTEGVAIGVIPVSHAWLTFRTTGHIVDLTMRLHERRQEGRDFCTDLVLGGPFPEPRAYFGVRFDALQVIEHVAQTEHYSPLIDDWQNKWPLLRRKD